MLAKNLTIMAFMAAMAAPALGAVGDEYELTSGGKQYGVLTLARVDAGSIKYTDDQLLDLKDSLNDSLNENYDTEGEAEYAGRVKIGDQNLEATVETSDSGSTLKEVFKESQWETINNLVTGTIMDDQTENDHSPAVLTINIQNTDQTGKAVGPCKKRR